MAMPTRWRVADMAAEVHETFDDLISISYLWGSPEWFQLRK
jgi:hypothetical protein